MQFCSRSRVFGVVALIVVRVVGVVSLSLLLSWLCRLLECRCVVICCCVCFRSVSLLFFVVVSSVERL